MQNYNNGHNLLTIQIKWRDVMCLTMDDTNLLGALKCIRIIVTPGKIILEKSYSPLLHYLRVR